MSDIVRHGMKGGMVVTFHENHWKHLIENGRCESRRGFLFFFSRNLGASEIIARVSDVEIEFTQSCDDKTSPE